MAEDSSSETEVPVSDAVTRTEVRVSGADSGAVVPVRAAVTTVQSSLSEADIAIIVDRVTRNLQPPTAGGTSVCPTSSEGEGDMVAIVCGRGRCAKQLGRSHVWFGADGQGFSAVFVVVHLWWELVFAKGGTVGLLLGISS